MLLSLRKISLLAACSAVTVNLNERHRQFILKGSLLLTSKLAIQAVGSEDDAGQSEEETDDCEDAASGVSKSEASATSR